MLDHINARVVGIKGPSIILSLGPIGVEVAVVSPEKFELNRDYCIYLYMHWNQEQGPSWYGFENQIDRDIFELIISCSGIGPRIGMAVLSDLGGARFIDAVQSGDDRTLSKVNGIGAKKAEQIIVQLKHKVSAFVSSGKIKLDKNSEASDWHTITQALEALNYSRGEIHGAVSHLRSLESKERMSFDHLMRKALSFLSKQH